VVDECVARGWQVTAFVRDRARLGRTDVPVATGDARDAAAVRAALAGRDAVLCCLGMHDITVPATDFSESLRTIVQAMQSVGARRIVAIASAGALDHPAGGLRSEHGLPDWLRNVAAEHARNLRTLQASGLDWTLMCPVDLKDDIARGHARMALDGLPPGSGETGYADLAAAMVALAAGDVALGAAIGHRVGIVSDRA
jgi:putative NADH-flavin reductase